LPEKGAAEQPSPGVTLENEVFVTKEGQPHYRIGPGDVLEVTLWKRLEETIYTVPVRQDGAISFTFLEDIPVSGLTAREVDDLITARLTKFVKKPRVDVLVKEYNSKTVTLLGAVKLVTGRLSGPGTYKLRGRTTLLKALSEAGGPSEKANLREVSVRHKNGKRLRVNLYKIINQGDVSQNVVLNDGDTVIVPTLEESRSKVFVFGEVERPGVYPMSDRMTLMEAVSLSGGFKQRTVLASARIIRGDFARPEVIACDLDKLLNNGDVSQNITLKDGDLVYLPKNTIGNISDFLRQIQPVFEVLLFPGRAWNLYTGEAVVTQSVN
jgi:polysaccharide export outer membrane protein